MESPSKVHPQDEWYANAIRSSHALQRAADVSMGTPSIWPRENGSPKSPRDPRSSLYQSGAYAMSSIGTPDDRAHTPILADKPRPASSRKTPYDISIRELTRHSTSSSSRIWNVSTPSAPLPPPPTPSLSLWHSTLLILTVCLAQLLSLSGQSLTIVVLPLISAHFSISDPARLSWFTAAYSLTLGTFILPAGRLGDIYGHKLLFLLGWTWFALGSLGAGLAGAYGGPVAFNVLRALQGIGPALLIPNAIALLGRTFPVGRTRNLAIAVFGGCGPVGFVVGSTFSALLAERAGWAWGFWVLAGACVGVGGLGWVVVPADDGAGLRAVREEEGRAGLRWVQRVDLAGAATGVAGLLLINFAFNQAPVVGWGVAYVPVLLVVGLGLMGVFVFVELRVAVRPIVPLRGLHRDAAFTLACIVAGWASHGIWQYYSYLLIEEIRGYSPLMACLQTFPVAIVGFSAAVAVPFILQRIQVPYLMSSAMTVFCIGTLLLATAPADQTYWANTFLSILIMPLAMNWSFPSGTILMSNAVSREHQGIAASLISTMVNYSISMGLGIAGSISRYVTTHHGVLAGYRAAWYFGLALSGTGLLISGYFVYTSRTKNAGMTRI